mmetsp:Transcript_5463/g.4994  ORF Transcript_5463/g.4994 Transcript_5463/m.4994 type:complete len:89 (+) Transcript_5463:274-540(+)
MKEPFFDFLSKKLHALMSEFIGVEEGKEIKIIERDVISIFAMTKRYEMFIDIISDTTEQVIIFIPDCLIAGTLEILMNILKILGSNFK